MAYTKISLLVALLTSVISSTSFAAGNRTDYDLDDDGLIEINDWADLNEIRNNATGKLYGTNLGCPVSGCIGYELTTDLDFDTNGDGQIDVNDTYWNAGSGWEPLATGDIDFEGNGHLIRNLIVKNTAIGGLFGYVYNINIRNLGLAGRLTVVEAAAYAGGLVGLMEGGSITGCFTTGRVTTTGNYAGGLVGASHGTKFKAVFSTAFIYGQIVGGGLVGSAEDSSVIDSSYAAGRASAANAYRGLAVNSGAIVTNSYWANDVITGANPFDTFGTQATLYELQCATSDTACSLYTCPEDAICSKPLAQLLFVGWDKVKDAKGNAYWDFGTTKQLPGLVLNGVLYRDGDGNGVLDSDEQNSSSSTSAISSPSSRSASSRTSSFANSGFSSTSTSSAVFCSVISTSSSAYSTTSFSSTSTSSTAASNTSYASNYSSPNTSAPSGSTQTSTASTGETVSSASSSIPSAPTTSMSSSSAQMMAVSSAVFSSTKAALSSVASSSASSTSSAPVVATASPASDVSAENKSSGGGGVDLWILLMLSSLGFARRGKKAV